MHQMQQMQLMDGLQKHRILHQREWLQSKRI